ncbi:hypothetical protein F0315_00005 [Vibrio cholerae]|nr:hypothetical protein F0315_00005 [Vibrio cholerae]
MLVFKSYAAFLTDNIYLQTGVLGQKRMGSNYAPHCRFLLSLVIDITFGLTADDLRSEKYIKVKKVIAHSGVRGNDIADSLAVDAERYDIDGVFINDLFEAKCSV